MFEELLEKVGSVLEKVGIPYMIIGGQAVLLHGEPRLTRDIDITLGISTEQIETFLPLIEAMDLKVLVDPHEFTMETMVLPCRDPGNDIRVDFIFSFSPYERQAIERACAVQLGEAQVMFASVEDLIIHKVFLGRPRDIEDVKSVLIKNPRADLGYIRRWLNEFTDALHEPFIERFETLIREIKKGS